MGYLILIFIICYSCKEKNASKDNSLTTQKETPNYDTLKFNTILTPDTTGCMWSLADRKILDTLIFEKAVVRTNTDTFLATSRYRRLLACSVPSFILIPNDTILISGYVYRIYAAESSYGQPTLVKQIVYSKK